MTSRRNPPSEERQLGRYLKRALRLQCPTCGESPIFLAVRRIRRLSDWFQPLDGCGRCGYAYEREPGYFLLATWGLTYGFAGGLGVIILFILEATIQPTTGELLLYILPVVGVVAFLIARHSKALFLAVDRFLDPGDGISSGP